MKEGVILFEIDLQSGNPIYKQVVEGFKKEIIGGEREKDDLLPSIRNLSISLRINPNTIKKAYMILEQEGFIYRVQGKGCFVKGLEEEQRRAEKEKIQELLKEAVERSRIMDISDKELKGWFESMMKEEGE